MLHSWEVLSSILSSDKTSDILCDIGMCVHFPFISRPSPSFLTSYYTFRLLGYMNINTYAYAFVHALQANNAQKRDI